LILTPSAHPYDTDLLSVEQNFLYCTNAPNTTLVPPPAGSECTTGDAGAKAVDAINLHMKVWKQGPEYIQTYMGLMRSILNPAELAKPLFNDEAGWGDVPRDGQIYLYDAIKESFIAPYYFLQWGNIANVQWFTWEDFKGNGLWDSTTSTVEPTGVAFGTLSNWLAGSTLTAPCTSSQVGTETIWTCGYTQGGANHLAIWDSTQTCSQATNSCATYDLTIGSPWTSYQDINGNVHAIDGGVVPVGLDTIVLSD
jgi:hypothetical protein